MPSLRVGIKLLAYSGGLEIDLLAGEAGTACGRMLCDEY